MGLGEEFVHRYAPHDGYVLAFSHKLWVLLIVISFPILVIAEIFSGLGNNGFLAYDLYGILI